MNASAWLRAIGNQLNQKRRKGATEELGPANPSRMKMASQATLWLALLLLTKVGRPCAYVGLGTLPLALAQTFSTECFLSVTLDNIQGGVQTRTPTRHLEWSALSGDTSCSCKGILCSPGTEGSSFSRCLVHSLLDGTQRALIRRDWFRRLGWV